MNETDARVPGGDPEHTAQEVVAGPGRRRRWWLVALGAAVVLAGAGATASSRGSSGGQEGGVGAAPATAKITRTHLVQRERVTGTLGYADAAPLVAQRPGTVTRLPAEGSVVRRGEALVEVDERPVLLLHGRQPAWRALGPGVEDGDDVTQLEENLVALGLSSFRPNERFDGATEAAVKRLQRHAGLEQTGVLELGDVVFREGDVRVGAHELREGSRAQPGATVYEATSTSRVVEVELDAGKQGRVAVGNRAEIRLPDGKTIAGTVSDVGRVARSANGQGEDSSDPTLPVLVALDDEAAAGALDQAPVDVEIETGGRAGVLAVPVQALLALSEGGYAVEIVEGRARRLVAVEIGMFAGGLVEVAGDGLSEEIDVVVPS